MSIKRFVSALLTGALCLERPHRLRLGPEACGSSGVSADAQRYSTIFYDAFDTVTQVIAYCDSEEEFTRQMDALHTDLLEYHRLYDIYNDYDGVVNVKTINDNAGARTRFRWTIRSSGCWNWPGRCTTPQTAS